MENIMSNFSDYVFEELNLRTSINTIGLPGTLLVKVDNSSVRNYIPFEQGTAGQVLVSNGPSNAPIWQDNIPFEINQLGVETIVAADYIPFFDVSESNNSKITFTDFESLLDLNNLINAGDFNIDGLDADTIADADTLPFYDDTGTHNNKITFANFESSLDHNNLINAGDFDIVSLNVDVIADADQIPFYDSDGGHNNKITFDSFESSLDHDNLIAGTIASHDTSATGAQLDTLTDNSVADALHRHSELVASDGDPDPALIVDASGYIQLPYDSQLLQFGAAQDYSVQWDGSNATHTITAGEYVFDGGTLNVSLTGGAGVDTPPFDVNLVTNWDFSIDLSDWNFTPLEWVWNTGEAEHIIGNVDPLFQAINVVDGKIYAVEFTISNRTAGTVTVTFGTCDCSLTAVSNGTYYTSFVANLTGPINLTFTPHTDFDGRLDDIKLQHVSGTTTPVLILKDSTDSAILEVRGENSVDNIYIGVNAGQYNITGDYNIALGINALSTNTDGYDNVAIGMNTLKNNIQGYNNIALGRHALEDNTCGSGNIGVGGYTLYTNTTGRQNIAIGDWSLYENTTGLYNVAIGTDSLKENIDGDDHIAIGKNALSSNEDGDANTAIGRSTLSDNISGDHNVAIGNWALNSSTGEDNVAIGYSSLRLTTGDFNAAFGYTTGYDVTTGDYNTLIGYNTGRGITTGDNNTIIGAQVTGLAADLQNHIILADGEGNKRIIVDASGYIQLPYDSQLLQFGVAQDYSVQWNGSNAVHTITAGEYDFDGGTLSVSLTGGTGIDAAAFGSNLVVNWDFLIDLSDWSYTLLEWVWNTGKAQHIAGNVDPLFQAINVVDGETYQLEFTISNRTAGTVTVTLGTCDCPLTRGSNATLYTTFKANLTGPLDLKFTPENDFDGRLDTIILRHLTGVSTPILILKDSSDSATFEVRGENSVNNTYIGMAAGQHNTYGDYNVAMGTNALSNNTDGYDNVAVGGNALKNNLSGYGNVAFGGYALEDNTYGYGNVGVGGDALNANTSGGQNTAIGGWAMYKNTYGKYNTAIGTHALRENIHGDQNTAIGRGAIFNNLDGDYNIGIGPNALYTNTTGDYNVAVGNYSLYTSTGHYNTSVGYDAMRMTTGQWNVGVGSSAGYDVTTGDHNTIIGYGTGRGITTGDNNTIIGARVTGLAIDLQNHVILADGAGNIRITVDDSGNMGVNDFTPSCKLDVNGAIASNTTTITASADDTDVSGVNTLLVNTTSGNITLGGLVGGVAGQILRVAYIGDWTNTLTLEDTEGINQDFYMHTRADETIDGGGFSFVCDGSNWYDVSHAKHV